MTEVPKPNPKPKPNPRPYPKKKERKKIETQKKNIDPSDNIYIIYKRTQVNMGKHETQVPNTHNKAKTCLWTYMGKHG